MYIKVSTLFIGLLVILGALVLIYIIVLIRKLISTLDRINTLLDSNKNNISAMLEELPKTARNLSELSDNLKTVSDVVTDTAASVIDTKENFNKYIIIVKDIVDIVRDVFSK